ncbi:alpha-ketoglutarate-dependent dioxygenase AlkB [Salibacteraceae bacterium]|jgi:alkylated DNA repair dioxygenase AlkB|nr:alpha-ketoglutarate-dependent dioxygenase AlkB [Salibacteraceae bacterium]
MNKSDLKLIDDFLPESKAVFETLLKEVAWEEREIKIFGKTYNQPRLIAWQGDLSYKYSGGTWPASPFSKTVRLLKNAVEMETGATYNGVLLNLYRNGNDSMGWHSDNEKELGVDPIVASLSLGEDRVFKIRPNSEKGNSTSLILHNNSLLVMKAGFQNLYEHSIPKTRKPKGIRINLTFRKLFEH